MMCSCANRPEDKNAIRTAIERELQLYPHQRLTDFYKSMFQGYWGPGHIVESTEDRNSIRQWLVRETAECNTVCGPVWHELGPWGRFGRLNLSVIKEGKLGIDDYCTAFINSAKTQNAATINDWKRQWKKIVAELNRMNITFENYQQDKQAIENMLNRGEYAAHHSRQFITRYNPHYRVISTEEYKMLAQKLKSDIE